MWAALVAGSIVAALLVTVVGLAGRIVDRSMGATAGMKPLRPSWQAIAALALVALATLLGRDDHGRRSIALAQPDGDDRLSVSCDARADHWPVSAGGSGVADQNAATRRSRSSCSSAAHLARLAAHRRHRRLRGYGARALLFPAGAAAGCSPGAASPSCPAQAGEPRGEYGPQACHPGDLRRLDPGHLGGVVRGAGIPFILLPPPAAIWRPHRQFAADAGRRRPPDHLQGCAGRLCARLRRGLPDRHPRRPRALPARGPAADRQHGVGAADHRRRADHGDVVRLRLAVQGRRGRRS